jgi:CheY-like chemotaxis protein/anti-sigma regulatory factor (Ser/Thr protein kinase)
MAFPGFVVNDDVGCALDMSVVERSHDLRQPVQSLVLLLSVIERQVANQPKTVETAKMMRAAVDGLHCLLTSVLDISSLDAGVVAPVAECVDLGALVSRLATEHAPKASNRALEFRSVPRKLHTRTDAALLERALRNLIENALRYTPKGGILLGIRSRGEFVRLDVIDTGIGIPADKQAEIFEEFHQLNNPGRNLEQGMGLGLAIVARLANLLGARVEVASRAGRGSRFSLTLPVVQEAAPIVDNLGAIDDPGGRILIIEDNAIVRNGLEAVLKQCGYETLVAGCSEDALDLAAKEAWRFEMIVADHRLGAGLTGIETAKVHNSRLGSPLTTSRAETSMTRAPKLGSRPVVSKSRTTKRPGGFRRKIIGVHHDGVSTHEMARTLGVARSTIRDNLGRAAKAGLTWPLAPDLTDDILEGRLFSKAGYR